MDASPGQKKPLLQAGALASDDKAKENQDTALPHALNWRRSVDGSSHAPTPSHRSEGSFTFAATTQPSHGSHGSRSEAGEGGEGRGCEVACDVESLKGEGSDGSEQRLRRLVSLAVNLSLAANVLLLILKCAVYAITRSNSIFATVADSVVDILSQLVIAVAAYKMRLKHPNYPVGRTRLETVGVIVSAGIMSVCSIEVIQTSVGILWQGFARGDPRHISVDLVSYLILAGATVLKVALWAFCNSLKRRSASALALAEDHMNDILSNLTAIATVTIASEVSNAWWVDPVGGGLIALYIIFRWVVVAKEHIEKLVGRQADEHFVEQVRDMTHNHHREVLLDAVRAYFFGQKYIVELEVIMPARMSVQKSHDIALALQHKVEALEDVERAFVHVDYQCRDEPEHKVERELERNNSLT